MTISRFFKEAVKLAKLCHLQKRIYQARKYVPDQLAAMQAPAPLHANILK